MNTNLMTSQTSSSEFQAQIKKVLKKGQEYIDNITLYDLEQYELFSCYLVSDFLTGENVGGFCVKSDGELCSVFSIKKGVGQFMRLEWLRMAKILHLDCFEHLIPFYEKAGFKVNELLENWDGNHLPKVAIMAQR